jgi:hypothetical protein
LAPCSNSDSDPGDKPGRAVTLTAADRLRGALIENKLREPETPTRMTKLLPVTKDVRVEESSLVIRGDDGRQLTSASDNDLIAKEKKLI